MNPHANPIIKQGNLNKQGVPILEVDAEPVQATMESSLSQGRPSKPLFGVLPLARLIPQDIHSVMDYASGAMTGAGATSMCPKAKAASIFLGTSVIGISLMTDYKLSISKAVPIEAHEVADHVWGLSAIALPFVLGYWKTAPRVALSHVISGAGTIISSLLTDYRAFRRRA